MNELLLTVDEFAARTRQHAQTVRRQIRRGDVPTVRTGRKYLIPAEALSPQKSPQKRSDANQSKTQGQYAEEIWGAMNSGDAKAHNAAIRKLATASPEVRQIVMNRSAKAASAFYATPEGEVELADWRALDGQPFDDDAGAYYNEEEEAAFRAA